MQQAVYTAQIHKNTIFGDVFYGTGNDLVFMNRCQGGSPFGFTFGFQQHPAGQHDIAAFTVVLQNLESKGFSHQIVKIANRPQIRLRAGQKGLNPDIHREAALDPRLNRTVDGFISVEHPLDFFPDFYTGRFFLGEHDTFFLVVPPFDHDFHFVTDFGFNRTGLVPEFMNPDLAFGFVTDINKHMILIDRDNAAGDDFPFGKSFEAFFIQIHHAFHAVAGALAGLLALDRAVAGNRRHVAILLHHDRPDSDRPTRFEVLVVPRRTPGALPEIWAYGLRNPWRIAFDALTGDLYIGDVGQSDWEEIDVLAPGTHEPSFGWSVMEGNECFYGRDCDPADHIAPAIVYPHVAEDVGHCSVIGGYVSNGHATREVLEFIRPCVDVMNIDLKAFSEDFYRHVAMGSLAPVLETIEYAHHETDVWVETTTLLIPGENDSPDEIDAILRRAVAWQPGEADS